MHGTWMIGLLMTAAMVMGSPRYSSAEDRNPRQTPDGLDPQRAEQLAAKVFQRRDANGDGKLTAEEMPQDRRERFQRLLARYDDDGDGAITKQQFIKALSERAGRGNKPRRGPGQQRGQFGPGQNGPPGGGRGPGQRRGQFGPGQDRSFGPPRGPGQQQRRGGQRRGRSGPGGQRPHGPPLGAELLRVLDSNHDGQISAEEISAASEALKSLDKDGDGAISHRELMPHPRRRGAGRPGGGVK